MQCQIELKSLLAGVLLAMCVFMALGASQSSFPAHFGRYQLVPADREARTYVIDSRAGRIWSRRSGSNYTQKYGFDVLAKVGILRYLECRQRCEIQKYFETDHDLHIPDSTIQELIVRFAQTMAALHVHNISRLRQRIEASGGYVLHVDGTCEAGSQIHFVCMMGPEPIVLWSAKIGSENAVEVRNVLQQVDQKFGRPAATMADLSGSIG